MGRSTNPKALTSFPDRALMAWLDNTSVGAIEVFIGSECVGVHGLNVLERYQRRGIGAALLEHACEEGGHSARRASAVAD